MPRVLIIEMDKDICHALKDAARATDTEITFLCPDDFKEKSPAEWVRRQKIDAVIISECPPDVSIGWVIDIIKSLRAADAQIPIVAATDNQNLGAAYKEAGATVFVHRTADFNAAGGLYKALELCDV